MFKKTLLACLALCLTLSVQAQSRFRFGFRFNPLISLSNVQDNNKSSITGLDKGGRFAFSSGLMATYGLSENFGIYTGVMFALKGFKSELEYAPQATPPATKRLVTHDANLTFLEIPLALHLTSSEVTTGMKVRGLIGLSANFLVGANTTRNEYMIDIKNRDNFKLKDLRVEADKVIDNTFNSPSSQPYSNLAQTKEKSGTQGYNIFVPDFIIGAGVDWVIEGIGSFDLGISYHRALGNVSKYALRGDDRATVSYLSFDIGYYFQ